MTVRRAEIRDGEQLPYRLGQFAAASLHRLCRPVD
jgi:hypothetical protein